MPNSPSIDISALDLDKTQLKSLERLLNHIEKLIQEDPLQASIFIYENTNEIVKLKTQKQKPNTNIIHVSVDELKKAFNAHWDLVQKSHVQKNHNYSSSVNLVLFYAVECGIKYVWLRNNILTGTDEIEEQTLITKDGHNFATWIKELKLSATIVGKRHEPGYPKIPSFCLSRGGSSLDIGKAHQAWRYGVEIKREDEQKLVEWLKSVCNSIEERINRNRK